MLLWQLSTALSLYAIIQPTEKQCFYHFGTAEQKSRKLGFYFAVQNGGDFDIDFEVKDPAQIILVQGSKEKQTDIVFAIEKQGEYSFCFWNGKSSVTVKEIAVDVTVEGEYGLHQKTKTDTGSLDKYVDEVYNAISNYMKNARFYSVRVRRNMHTVENTESRIFTFAFLQSFIMVTSAILQVWFVRNYLGKPKIKL